jgi:anti-sigma factor RsiW
MSCSPFDLRDYFFEELPETERRKVDAHVRACPACTTELDRLRLTRGALMSVPDEEMPQRIGFVSDKVFEPSAARRWWAAFWGSAAKLGFASAAMLSVALVVLALHRPAPVAPPAPVLQSQAPDVSQKIDDALRKAIAETQERDDQRTKALLAAAERRHDLEHRMLEATFQENLMVIRKKMNVMTVASSQ